MGSQLQIMFEVETGTGSSTANSYVSVQYFTDFWATRGRAFPDSTETVQAWLIESTEYVDSQYQYLGTWANVDQSLEWPRTGAYRRNQYIGNDEIPTDLKDSVCQLAGEVKRRNGLLPIDDGVKSSRVGPVSMQYATGASRVTYPAADRALRYLIRDGEPAHRVN